jgi:hypothetical protein
MAGDAFDNYLAEINKVYLRGCTEGFIRDKIGVVEGRIARGVYGFGPTKLGLREELG